ncbi:MAG: phosphodiester glycosidase family protein [Deinococcus sp.]|nr:phosphodiester glycosidase family protein [Deinococcus sp.]
MKLAWIGFLALGLVAAQVPAGMVVVAVPMRDGYVSACDLADFLGLALVVSREELQVGELRYVYGIGWLQGSYPPPRPGVGCPELPLAAAAQVLGVNTRIEFVPPGTERMPAPPLSLAAGLGYDQVPFATAQGPVELHVVRADLQLLEPQVLFSSGQRAPVGELAQAAGALAALNVNYFDPPTGLPIGLIRSGGRLLQDPYNPRAAIGVRGQEVRIARVSRAAQIFTSGQRIDPALIDSLQVLSAGVALLAPGERALVVQGGTLMGRSDSPVAVPPGAAAIIYQPGLIPVLDQARPLVSMQVNRTWSDPFWAGAEEAAGAGPLLVQHSQVVSDFSPERFQADVTQRRTSRGGVGLDRQGRLVLFAGGPLSLEELAQAAVALGLLDAMQVDSGSSTSLVVAGQRVNGLGEGRAVPVALGLLPRQ